MAGESDRRRFWSDGHGIYHIATMGERLFAGFWEWAAAVFIGGFFAASVTVQFVLSRAENPEEVNWYVFGDGETGGILLFYPLLLAIPPIVHLASGIVLASVGQGLGYRAMTLRVKRDNLEQLSWQRVMLRQFIGSPGLMMPCLLVVLMGVPYLCLRVIALMFDLRINVLDVSDDQVNTLWSIFVWTYWTTVPLLVFANHLWMRIDAKGRPPHDVLLDVVVVQDRILSTNRAAFPSMGRAPVERWN